MRSKKRHLWMYVLLPLLVGGVAWWITRHGIEDFSELPTQIIPLYPPQWVFPAVWTVLYALMGVASYLIASQRIEKEEMWECKKEKKRKALMVYGLQLAVNFLWPIVFFNEEKWLWAFGILVVLWILVFIMIRYYAMIKIQAAYLMIPYLVWLTYAGYLNLAAYMELPNLVH